MPRRRGDDFNLPERAAPRRRFPAASATASPRYYHIVHADRFEAAACVGDADVARRRNYFVKFP
jgi:hypothetical protein